MLHRDRDALGVTAAHGRVPRLPTRVRASLSGADMDSNEGGGSPGPVLAWEGEMRAGPEASEGTRQALAAANSSPGNRGRHVVYTAASTATTAGTSNGADASPGASGERAAGVSEPRARAPVSGGGVGVGVATESNDLYEGGHLFAAPGEAAACGSAWQRAWTWTAEDSVLREADPRAGLGQVHDGEWRVIALEARDLQGSLHLFGTRYPPRINIYEALINLYLSIACQPLSINLILTSIDLAPTSVRHATCRASADIAEVLVYGDPLHEDDVKEVVSHLVRKYHLDTPPAGAVGEDQKISKQQLVQRLRDVQQMHQATPPRAAETQALVRSQWDIPKWLERYGQCFEVVESIVQSQPLPPWFRDEITPPGPSTVANAGSGGDTAVAWSAGAPGVGDHGVREMPTGEALFDRQRCGANASLDAGRGRVEFTGMASVLLTSALPPEGVHVRFFDILGRDQCLVGIATPDVDVESYLGHRRGGYGFFAAEGTLKMDGDWKGGHGLTKYKRGDRVGVHVDMTRRTLQFSISHEVDDAASQALDAAAVVEGAAVDAEGAAERAAASGDRRCGGGGGRRCVKAIRVARTRARTHTHTHDKTRRCSCRDSQTPCALHL